MRCPGSRCAHERIDAFRVLCPKSGRAVSGVVTDAIGPVAGAAVFVKDGANGVTTDLDGAYTLTDLNLNDVIVVSLLGYQTQEIVYTGQTTLNVLLAEESTLLEGVVVTAMGIERQEESLTYAAETVGGSDVNDIKSVNMINSLQGKAAGLVITPNSTGAGGSSKILFRGSKSISGSNQPLIVIDGVPVMNSITTAQVASNYGGERDGGDVMSTINPDDIKSISLLKGASAAALYGAVAANGAIMITTKSAQSGKVNVNFSSNTTVETPLTLPKFQNSYGMSDNGSYSWGDKLSSSSPNYLKEFFRTGVTTNNSVAVSGGSYSIVGNDVPVFMSNLLYSLGSQGVITAPDKAPFRTLKPEMTHSVEAGFDGAFFNDRFNISATWYKTNTKNQFFSVAAPYESGLRNRYVNAGDVQNQGFEFSASWYEPFTPDFSWETGINLSYNNNTIKELVDDLPNGLTLSDFGGAKIILKEGGSYGDLYVRHIMRDENGKPQKNDQGQPILSGDDDFTYAGNMTSKVNASWTNTFRYKNFTLSFLIDGRFGGKVLSMTEAALDGWGVSQRSGDARDAGQIVVDGVSFEPRAWYETTGLSNYNSQYANENYVYSATNIRLRELSIGYTFRDVFGAGKNITASLIGRNLFFFYKDAPMDPDVSAGTGNGIQGVDMFALPTTRSFGLNLKLNF